MRRLPVTAVLVAVAVLLGAAATASAAANLWLYPDTEDPRNGGHVLDVGTFTLFVENVGSGDDTAEGVLLVVAVNDLELLTSASFTLDDGTEYTLDPESVQSGFPELPCSLAPMPPHGIYPSDFALFELGDIGAGEAVAVAVAIEGEPGLQVHFDAMARGEKQTGRSTKCYDVVNPFGHDVTVLLPEVAAAECEVSIEKSAASSGVDVGEELEYSIAVTNSGECDLTEVEITEDIPTVDAGEGEDPVPAFSVSAYDPAPTTETEESLLWTLEALASGEETAVSLTVIFDEELADGQEVVNTACVNAAELEEAVCSSFEVAVGEQPAGDAAGGAGFWCNRMRLAIDEIPGASFTVEELQDLLNAVAEASSVFGDAVDAGTPELARAILCQPRGSDALGRLHRQLLALRLSVAAELVDPELTLDELCPGEEELPPDADGTMTVAGVLEAAETAIVGDADRATLLGWMEIIDFINNSSPPGAGGCEEAQEAEVLRVRRGFGRNRH
jgi:uncharacterized repeat protein (TIGR01451 family)